MKNIRSLGSKDAIRINLNWSRYWSHFFNWYRDPIQQSSLCDRYRARKISRQWQSWIYRIIYMSSWIIIIKTPQNNKFAWSYSICTENYDDVAMHLQIPISNNPQYAAIYVPYCRRLSNQLWKVRQFSLVNSYLSLQKYILVLYTSIKGV